MELIFRWVYNCPLKRIGSYILLSKIVLTFFACCKIGQVSYNGIGLEDKQIYIFFRETKSKAGLVSKSYNINNKNYSHVGIGAVYNNELFVYHILYNNKNDIKQPKSELIKDDISTFYNPQNDKVISGAILKVNGITIDNLHAYNKVIGQLQKRVLRFDKKFTTDDDDNFYCSELVYYILHKTKNDIILKPITRNVSGLDKIVLGRTLITYYPTDIFFNQPYFKAITAW